MRLAPARRSLIREQWARVCWSDETIRPDGEQTLAPSAPLDAPSSDHAARTRRQEQLAGQADRGSGADPTRIVVQREISLRVRATSEVVRSLNFIGKGQLAASAIPRPAICVKSANFDRIAAVSRTAAAPGLRRPSAVVSRRRSIADDSHGLRNVRPWAIRIADGGPAIRPRSNRLVVAAMFDG